MQAALNPIQNRRREAGLAARQCEQLLKQEFGVKDVYLFGSLAGQSVWHSRSDIDLAVEGLSPDRYISALTACYQLLPTGMELDLITLESAPPELVLKAKQEALMSQNAAGSPIAALTSEIAVELKNMQRLIEENKGILDSVVDRPSSLELRALGSIIHDFYTACERIFERVAVSLGPAIPMGDQWHTTLPRSMESNVEGTRPALLEHNLATQLNEYLRFRHLFRHSYGYELEWERLRVLVERLDMTKKLLEQQIENFVLALKPVKE